MGAPHLTHPATGMGGLIKMHSALARALSLEPSQLDVFEYDGGPSCAPSEQASPSLHAFAVCVGGSPRCGSDLAPVASCAKALPPYAHTYVGSSTGCGSDPALALLRAEALPTSVHTYVGGSAGCGSDLASTDSCADTSPLSVPSYVGGPDVGGWASASAISAVGDSPSLTSRYVGGSSEGGSVSVPLSLAIRYSCDAHRVDARVEAARSPFLRGRSDQSPHDALAAFEMLISIVLSLGASSLLPPSLTPSDLDRRENVRLTECIAARFGVRVASRMGPRNCLCPLVKRWQWLLELSRHPAERLIFHCSPVEPPPHCYATVLSGAVAWLRGRSSVARPPPLVAGDWCLADIFCRWPPELARELASFSWPLTSLDEFKRLLGCRWASPVAIVGCEFTGAVRDAYSRMHGRVAISVDSRHSLVAGPHAVLDLADVLMLRVWLDAFIFPPCTHQVLSDTRSGSSKRSDGRSFWGIGFFIFCWCVVAHRVRVEQPNTIIPDYLFHPTQRLRPCDAGDPDVKPINLYERGWGPLALLSTPVAAASGHRRLQDFDSAEDRDRWRSSWQRFPLLCVLVVTLSQQQLDDDAALDWRWRRMGPAGEPCDEHDADAIWGLPPPVGGAPDFLSVMETFAVAWYWAGLPVPADYLNGRPHPTSEVQRCYQSTRGHGHGLRLNGVIPHSLRDLTLSVAQATLRTGAHAPLIRLIWS